MSLIPSNEPISGSGWARSGVVLKWRPGPSGERCRVTFICFEPPPALWVGIHRLNRSSDWEDVCSEPYLMLDMIFDAWHRFVDENVWTVLDLTRESEVVSQRPLISLMMPP